MICHQYYIFLIFQIICETSVLFPLTLLLLLINIFNIYSGLDINNFPIARGKWQQGMGAK